jgi:trans-aconitate methyltransferase
MTSLYSNYYNESTEVEALQTMESKFSELERYIQNRSDIQEILDYGCGVDGYLPSRSESLKVRIDGFEVSPKTLDILRSRFPKSQFFDPRSFGESNNRYDLIVLSDVLEHLSNPKELLDCLTAKLKEGGQIWIQQPLENNTTLFTVLLKVRIFLTYSKLAEIPPFHVSLASRKSISILLDRCNLEVMYYRVIETMWPANDKIDLSSIKNSTLTVIKFVDQLASYFLKNYGTRGIFLVRQRDGAPN